MKWYDRFSQLLTGPRGAAAALLALAVLLAPAPAFGQDQSGVTSPAPGSAISGDVPVLGTASIEPFQKYELHFKLEPSGDDAYIYFDGGTSPIVGGQLGVWHAAGLAPGTYTLRLRVVKQDGNYAEFYTPNLSVNGGAGAAPPGAETPSPTPTSGEPTPTAIPTATFTPAPQPTAAVGQVTQPEAVQQLAPTPDPQAVAAAPDPALEPGAVLTEPIAGTGSTGSLADLTTGAATEGEGGSLTRELGEALGISRLRSLFFTGVRLSAAGFLLFFALVGGKRLYAWLRSNYM